MSHPVKERSHPGDNPNADKDTLKYETINWFWQRYFIGMHYVLWICQFKLNLRKTERGEFDQKPEAANNPAGEPETMLTKVSTDSSGQMVLLHPNSTAVKTELAKFGMKP